MFKRVRERLQEPVAKVKENLPAATAKVTIKNRVADIPKFAFGSAELQPKRWNAVIFSPKLRKEFTEPPQIFLFANPTVTKTFSLTIPDFDIPQLPTIDIDIGPEDWSKICKDQFYASAVNTLGDWTPAFNWMRDTIAHVFSSVGWALGAIYEFFYNIAIRPKFQRIEDKFNAVAEHLIGELNWGIDEVTNRFNVFSKKLTNSFQFPTGLAPTVLNMRAISTNGFQVLNSTDEIIIIHYLCIGE